MYRLTPYINYILDFSFFSVLNSRIETVRDNNYPKIVRKDRVNIGIKCSYLLEIFRNGCLNILFAVFLKRSSS